MRRTQLLILFAALFLGCVDPVNLSLPVDQLPFVVEGSITDNPSAPDTIRLSKAYPIDGRYYPNVRVQGAKLWITDKAGLADTLIDRQHGAYVTNQLQGKIGETYTLHGRLPDGTLITSSPQTMLPSGSIDSIYHELASRVNEKGTREYGINVFINTSVDAESQHRMRWKFNGTYVFVSAPELARPPKPCATGCLCCTCWASEREDLPLVANASLVAGPNINRVFVKYIPINGFTFYIKYRVEVTQMELSPEVFEFYSGVRKQLEFAGSLFQPPNFALNGNITASPGKTPVIGVFAAAAEAKAIRYIYRKEVPFEGTTLLPADCRTVFDHSTNVVPPYWN